jgi:hypothetical protein
MGDYVYREIQTMKRKPVKPYESLKKLAPKRLRHDRDDDRGDDKLQERIFYPDNSVSNLRTVFFRL